MIIESMLDPFFRRLELRDTLSNEEKLALQRAAHEHRFYKASADLVVQGDYPDVSSLLLTGLTSRYNLTDRGFRQITAIHVPGDFVDIHSFTLKKMDHSVGALSDVAVLTFPHAALQEITEKFPHLTRLLWLMSTLDGAIHRRWLVAMGRTSATEHLAHFVCETYMRLESIGLASAHRMVLPITQEELGDVLGLSAVHVNRVLQDLRRQDAVRWIGNEIEIPDWARLAALGQFDGDHLFLERLPR